MKANEVLNALEEGILVVNEKGLIIYCNQAYSRLVSKTLDQLKGVHISQVRPGAKITEVIASGKRLDRIYREEDCVEYYANIYPIYENDRIAGGVSVVTPMHSQSRPLLSVNFQQHTLAELTAAHEKAVIREVIDRCGDSVEGKKQAARQLGISLATLYNKLKQA